MQNTHGISATVQRGSFVLMAAALIVAASAAGCGSDGNGDGGTGGNGSGGGAHGGASGTNPNLARFSFFVLSLSGARTLSGSPDGFGGDLRHGETGAGAGLRGADKICSEAAEAAMPGAGAKAWRAFLSTTEGPVHAKDRVGTGPWYDALGRLVASDLTQLLKERPGDADLAIRNDLPNEFGIPNGSDGSNNHAILTGSGTDGTLYDEQTPATDSTCSDWTSSEKSGAPRCGHSWPRGTSGTNWISSLEVGGCAPCVTTGTACVGSTGGYGGIYCFVTNAP
jgi:hypothetical protein